MKKRYTHSVFFAHIKESIKNESATHKIVQLSHWKKLFLFATVMSLTTLFMSTSTNYHVDKTCEDTYLNSDTDCSDISSINTYFDGTVKGIQPFIEASNQESENTFQLFSHGKPGELYIEGEWKNAAQIAKWLSTRSPIPFTHSSIHSFTHLNIYGCEFAKGEKGQAAIEYLEENSTYEWIKKVVFGSISNRSDNDNGYGDYTNKVANVSPNQSVNIKLVPDFLETDYEEYWTVWIDFNQDGDFTDANENVFSANGTTTQTGTVTIPGNALSGATRMRVSMRWNAAPNSCQNVSYGEVEDYTVNIVNAREEVLTAPSFNLYPNPARHILNIDFEDVTESEGTAQIFSSTGKFINQQQIPSGANDIDMPIEQLATGVYIIQLQFDDGTYATQRFVKF